MMIETVDQPTPTAITSVDIPIDGMTCTDCARQVQRSIERVPGVQSVDVLLGAEKAMVSYDPAQADLPRLHRAVEATGYRVTTPDESSAARSALGGFSGPVLVLLAAVFGIVLFLAVVGEALGFFDAATDRVPWLVWLGLIVAGGYPVFRGVLQATLQRRVTSHTLMTVGMLAAVVVGEWSTGLLVVFFMRMADYVEAFTSERARRAVKDLTAIAPQTARVLRDTAEVDVPVTEVGIGEVVIVRPGEQIPVDGQVIDGQATVDQATITGESMPVEAGPGARVFAATFARMGSLRVRTTDVGADTTFGRVIKLVEEAEGNRADVQRLGDRFATWYLPVVATIATLTFVLSQNAIATAAVLVVACSCSFALATPIAVVASIGASAKRGLLIKGGKYIEALAQADVLLVDKTGTLTLGQPQITDVVSLNGLQQAEILHLAASAERYSEHPLAEAVRQNAQQRGLVLSELQGFEAIPGQGVRARVDGASVSVGSARLILNGNTSAEGDDLQAQGKTLLFVAREGQPVGILAAADTLREEVPHALAAVQRRGMGRIELLTGDNERVASALAARLGIAYQANLLPEDKIAIVRKYQSEGHIVAMVGDGVNDAPALAQANVGIAMGAAGSHVAIEAAHVALMREDWALVPEVFRIAQRTMQTVKMNIGFTAVYNMIGLSLAAFGIIPPVLAAAAQSLPDIGILGNSSRLLRQKPARVSE